MTRKIIGTIITVLVAVRMLMTSNQTWLDVISDWTFTFCALVSLLFLMSDARHWRSLRIRMEGSI